jgi:hypothetical protein
MKDAKPAGHSIQRAEHERKSLTMIQKTIQGLRFGIVTVVVQDGLVVQVERTEKFRLLTHREVEGFREGDGI